MIQDSLVLGLEAEVLQVERADHVFPLAARGIEQDPFPVQLEEIGTLKFRHLFLRALMKESLILPTRHLPTRHLPTRHLAVAGLVNRKCHGVSHLGTDDHEVASSLVKNKRIAPADAEPGTAVSLERQQIDFLVDC